MGEGLISLDFVTAGVRSGEWTPNPAPWSGLAQLSEHELVRSGICKQLSFVAAGVATITVCHRSKIDPSPFVNGMFLFESLYVSLYT